MKDLFKNKNVLIIAGIVIVVVLIAIIIGLGANKKEKEEQKMASLDENLISIGRKFYEEHYHINLEDSKTLQVFQNSGLNISLTNLNVIVKIDEETNKILDSKKCNRDETRIIIYPKEPFGVKDYTIKAELSCEK